MGKQEDVKGHEIDVQVIKNELLNWKSGQKNSEVNHSNSHVMRKKDYKKEAPPLSTRKLNRVLDIDPVNKIAWFEPSVTQDQLVDACLKYGLVPPVVAEFKKITWGGAIMGSSLESSSHRYGQLNDSCIEYELLLGNGSVIHASREKNSDLFWGVSGSYGSLALLLSIKMTLVPAKKFVEIQIQTFPSVQKGINYLRNLCHDDYRPDFIEAIVYSPSEFKVMTGKMANDEVLPVYSIQNNSSKWYYQVVKFQKDAFRMTLSDYLFRFDRGAFWMGSYAMFSSLLARFLLENTPFMSDKWLANLKTYPAGKYNQTQFPSPLFRKISGRFMDSNNLYKWLHWKKENWFEKNFVIQDFYLPEENAATFIDQSIEKNGIFPIWICPCKATSDAQLLSPHQQPCDLVFDVGVYGWPLENKPYINNVRDQTRFLEELTYKLKGRKMFYSWNFMDVEDIWKNYDKEAFRSLRIKSHAQGVFPTFTKKIL